MPVVVCKSEEQRDVCKGADSCISIDFFWPGNRLKWLLKLGGPRRLSLVSCHCFFKMDMGLMLESRVSTSHHFEYSRCLVSPSAALKSRKRGHDFQSQIVQRTALL